MCPTANQLECRPRYNTQVVAVSSSENACLRVKCMCGLCVELCGVDTYRKPQRVYIIRNSNWIPGMRMRCRGVCEYVKSGGFKCILVLRFLRRSFKRKSWSLRNSHLNLNHAHVSRRIRCCIQQILSTRAHTPPHAAGMSTKSFPPNSSLRRRQRI